MLTVISLGAGVQSTTLLLMAERGEIEPRPDCAIFSDTQFEPAEVYTHLEWLESICEIPIIRVTQGNLRADALDDAEKFVKIPVYSRNKDGKPSMLGRQCTYTYKIRPIYRKLQELRKEHGAKRVTLMLGISLDEVQRMKPARVQYVENTWPLIDKRMSRLDCLLWLERNGYPRAPKSACIGCPLHDKAYWRHLRDTSPAEWQDAVAFDTAIRNKSRVGEPVYLHQSLVPLTELDLSTPGDRGQLSFDMECEGLCGV